MVRENKPSAFPWLPIVMIALGAIVLMVNFGWFSWGSLQGVLQLWPLILIAIGADLLLHGRYRLAVLAATVVVGALLFSGTVTLPGMQPARSEPVEQALGGAQRARIVISGGVSDLRLGATDAADTLIVGTIEARRGERIVQRGDVSGGSASFELSSEQRNVGLFNADTGRHRWQLSLTDRVPIDLKVDTGVGRADLDLSDLQLSALDVGTGVGALVLTLPRSGGYTASVDTGVGAATVRIPEGVAVRIDIDRGLGAVNVRGDLLRSGDSYTTPGYAEARERVELRISTGVGAISLESGF